jgi:hypothetical protein
VDLEGGPLRLGGIIEELLGKRKSLYYLEYRD